MKTYTTKEVVKLSGFSTSAIKDLTRPSTRERCKRLITPLISKGKGVYYRFSEEQVKKIIELKKLIDEGYYREAALKKLGLK